MCSCSLVSAVLLLWLPYVALVRPQEVVKAQCHVVGVSSVLYACTDFARCQCIRPCLAPRPCSEVRHQAIDDATALAEDDQEMGSSTSFSASCCHSDCTDRARQRCAVVAAVCRRSVTRFRSGQEPRNLTLPRTFVQECLFEPNVGECPRNQRQPGDPLPCWRRRGWVSGRVRVASEPRRTTAPFVGGIFVMCIGSLVCCVSLCFAFNSRRRSV